MPADFSEIADYHRQEAARHAALAQLAQENWSRAEAAYHGELALRHAEAAQEQLQQGENQQPGPAAPPSVTSRWPAQPVEHRPPLAARFVSAAVQGAGQLAAVIRHAVHDRGGGGPRGLSPR